jgi:hypothetical protein
MANENDYLVYYDMTTITAVKSFILQAHSELFIILTAKLREHLKIKKNKN